MLCTVHHRYLKGALIPETDGDAVAHGAPTGRRRDYVPSTAPGSRLPHMNVKVLSDMNKEVSRQFLYGQSSVNFKFIKERFRLSNT